MEMTDPRGWVFYYLICFVALLWVGFLTSQGAMLFVSLFLTLVVLGFSILLCVMLIIDIRKQDKQGEAEKQAEGDDSYMTGGSGMVPPRAGRHHR